MQMLHISSYRLVESSLVGADVVIEPQVGHINHGSFHQVQECVLRGKLAAQGLIPEIRKHI